jgi:hypothetical protein
MGLVAARPSRRAPHRRVTCPLSRIASSDWISDQRLWVRARGSHAFSRLAHHLNQLAGWTVVGAVSAGRRSSRSPGVSRTVDIGQLPEAHQQVPGR